MRNHKELLILLKKRGWRGSTSSYFSVAHKRTYGVITFVDFKEDDDQSRNRYPSKGKSRKVKHRKSYRLGQGDRKTIGETKCKFLFRRRSSAYATHFKEQHVYKDCSFLRPTPSPLTHLRPFQLLLSDFPPLPHRPNLDQRLELLSHNNEQTSLPQLLISTPSPLSIPPPVIRQNVFAEISRDQIIVGTMNVRTLKCKDSYVKMKAGKIGRPEDKRQQLILEMKIKGIEFMCLQEVRCNVKDMESPFIVDGYAFYYSSTVEFDKLGRNGVGIVLPERMMSGVDKVYQISDRILIITGIFKRKKFAVASIDAPTNSCKSWVKDCFYSELGTAVQGLDNCYKNRLIFGDDFNARVGGVHECCDKFSMRDEPNDNGLRSLDFCSSLGLVIGDTLLRPTEKRREGTWYHSSSKSGILLTIE